MNMSTVQSAYYKSPIGVVRIEGDKEGVRLVDFCEEDQLSFSNEVPECLVEAHQQIQEYFEGIRKEFNFTLNSKGTDFQRTVWDELVKVPYGQTASYAELAQQIQNPKAVRAVANANRRNPIGIVVPCHRIIGSNGSLTGYAGGLWRKEWLLNHENKYKHS
jgi:methylated-DNA-[protein]-cysteine S-methyltransferase